LLQYLFPGNKKNGEIYYVAYEPLTDDSGKIYGMAFVGLKKIKISEAVTIIDSIETKSSMQDLSITMEALSEKANSLNEIAKVLDEEMAFFR